MQDSHPIRVLIVDDHPMIRDGLTALLTGHADMTVVAEAENGEQALARYDAHHPDIVLMDLRMPVMDGLAATRALLALDDTARIIMLTTFEGDADIERALTAGARAFLLKDQLRTHLPTLIRDVFNR
ncbi:response regulator [Gemmatimonas groenlandica]|uniref:Response regulator transcription factor n=1 Tax=Gemmatimonas groenlandica TaxID=2732249 RepID=A0A6M4IV69_9BACT|nr:response regulator transcription factor [Gemmatimonas groenlandica]QJR37487.1 response regulator transcription factor [Gemmatimonas groenlandica]